MIALLRDEPGASEVATALRIGAPIATGVPEILALPDIFESIDLRRER